MQPVNLYWPVYKNLEKEILTLANEIQFDDKQISAYSIRIADLIFRCSIEIESISKDIYRIETKKEPTKPGDCLNYFENNWLISKKIVIISSTNFYFDKQFRPYFCPFNYTKNSEEDYYSAYCALKHDRVKNIDKANINNLVRVMSSLYLLNIYYKSESFYLGNNSEGTNFDQNLGSELFSIKQYVYTKEGTTNTIEKIDQDEFIKSVYILKLTDNSYINHKKAFGNISEILNEKLVNHPKFNEILNKNVAYVSSDINGRNLFFDILGEEEYIKTVQKIPFNSMWPKNPFYESIINKNQQEIYPKID